MSRHNQTAVLERFLGPVTDSLNVEAARKLVRLKADAKTQAQGAGAFAADLRYFEDGWVLLRPLPVRSLSMR